MSLLQEMSSDELADRLFDTVQELEDISPFLNCTIYGDQGVGKTVLAVKVAQAVTDDGKTILYLESDPEGWVSLRNHDGLLHRVQRMQYKALSQIDGLVRLINEGHPRFADVGTVVVDTVSAIADSDLMLVVKERAKKDPTKDPSTPKQPDFGANTNRIIDTFMPLLSAPVNVIFISHQREDKDERTGVVYIRPAFTPKLGRMLGQPMTLIGFMTAINQTGENGEDVYRRLIQCQPTRTVLAKSRMLNTPTTLQDGEFIERIVEWQNSGAKLVETAELAPENEGLNFQAVESESGIILPVVKGLEI